MKYVWAIFTNAESGAEAEFNEWYDGVHVPDLLKIPGVTSAERFHLAPVQTKPGPDGIEVVQLDQAELKYKYLALYIIETDDIEGVLQNVALRAGSSEMVLSSALSSDIGTMCYQQLIHE
ncbi:MAG: hypothetical protein EOP24_40990 [Hyphomicrobiales bacterium]|nr:MAG: hypothetical protein EOP24_40990 [Hyphomicrobiales bacterium]